MPTVSKKRHSTWADIEDEEDADFFRAPGGGSREPPPPADVPVAGSSRQALAAGWAQVAEAAEQEDNWRSSSRAAELRDEWHEGLDVARGTSHHRLDLSHGFVHQIVRNQKDRDAYEKAWRESLQQGNEYQQRWGRAKVQRDGREWGMPEPWRSMPQQPQQQQQQLEAQPASQADAAGWWRKPAPKPEPSRMLARPRGAAAAGAPASGGASSSGGVQSRSGPGTPSASAALLPAKAPAPAVPNRILAKAMQAAMSGSRGAGCTQPAAAGSSPAAGVAPVSPAQQQQQQPAGTLPAAPAAQQQQPHQQLLMPVMVQLKSGGYALVMPAAAGQALPGQAMQRAQATSTAQAALGSAGTMAAAAAAGHSATPADAAPQRKPVRVREGYIAYTPPPRLRTAAAVDASAGASASQEPISTSSNSSRHTYQAPPLPLTSSPAQQQRQQQQLRRQQAPGSNTLPGQRGRGGAPNAAEPAGRAIVKPAQRIAPGRSAQQQQQQNAKPRAGLLKQGPAAADATDAKSKPSQQQRHHQATAPPPQQHLQSQQLESSTVKKKRESKRAREKKPRGKAAEQAGGPAAGSAAGPSEGQAPSERPEASAGTAAAKPRQHPEPEHRLQPVLTPALSFTRRSGGAQYAAEQSFDAELEDVAPCSEAATPTADLAMAAASAPPAPQPTAAAAGAVAVDATAGAPSSVGSAQQAESSGSMSVLLQRKVGEKEGGEAEEEGEEQWATASETSMLSEGVLAAGRAIAAEAGLGWRSEDEDATAALTPPVYGKGPEDEGKGDAPALAPHAQQGRAQRDVHPAQPASLGGAGAGSNGSGSRHQDEGQQELSVPADPAAADAPAQSSTSEAAALEDSGAAHGRPTASRRREQRKRAAERKRAAQAASGAPRPSQQASTRGPPGAGAPARELAAGTAPHPAALPDNASGAVAGTAGQSPGRDASTVQAGRLHALSRRQQSVLLRIASLEQAVSGGNSKSSGPGSTGPGATGRPARRQRLPLILYQAPRREADHAGEETT